MATKMKFWPVVTMVKLNPEQAVLTCSCYTSGRYGTSTTGRNARATICQQNQKVTNYCSVAASAARS